MKKFVNIYPALDVQKDFEVTADIQFVGYHSYETIEEAEKNAGGGRVGVAIVDED